MNEITGFQSAIFGLRKNLQQFEKTASKLVKSGADGDLATNLVELDVAKAGVQANSEVVQAVDETLGTMLDTLR